MLKFYDEVRKIVAVNQTGPIIYLYPVYSYYSMLLSDRLKMMTENIFVQSKIPDLPVRFIFLL